jgi:hypothetical protein
VHGQGGLRGLSVLGVLPLRSGPGVEQHAHDRQVDLGPRAVQRAAAGKTGVELRTAIDTAGLEVPPAAVQRNAQVGKAPADHRLHARGHVVQAGAVEREVR